MRVILSKSAARWLRTEMQYLQQRSPSAAGNFVSRIADARLLPGAHPEAGPVARARPFLAAGRS